jgi:adenylosuccinate synthase
VIAIAVAFISDKTNRRGVYLAIFTLPAIAGFSIMRWATNPDVRYGGIFLITIGAFPGGPGFLAWAANNAAGPAIRSVSTAYVVTLGTAGGILATWYAISHRTFKVNHKANSPQDVHHHGRTKIPNGTHYQ